MLPSGMERGSPVNQTFVRVLVVTAVSVLAVAGAACARGDGTADAAGTPSSSRSAESETVTPIPEGQSLMDPGSYVAQTEPNITLTTTTPWYGAANSPGFVDLGQLDHFPYAELFLLNLDEVVRDPSDPGDPLRLRPAPEDLFGWLVDQGMEIVGKAVPVEIDGFPGRQADIRVPSDAACAPKYTRPFPQACLLFFKTSGEPPEFAFTGWMAYRITVLPDVGGQTVTLLYTDYPGPRFDERAAVADEVVRSIEFDV